MTRQAQLASLMRGVGEDLRDYRTLRALLQDQFVAALHYETGRLADLGVRITGVVDALSVRRAQRVTTVRGLLAVDAPEGAMEAVFPLLAAAPRASLEQGWRALEALVRECKQFNERNCRLMVDQNSIMQRVLHGEEQTYVPT